MSYEDYWGGDPEMFSYFMEAHITKTTEDTKQKQLEADILAWRVGMYVLNAIGTAFSDKRHSVKYPKQPFAVEELIAQDEKLDMERKQRESLAALMRYVAHAAKDLPRPEAANLGG